MKLTANFSESEFLIHETPPDSIRSMKLPAVASLCQWLRDLAGSYGVVTSYFRSPARNAAVGGVNNSQHELGEAADLEFPLVSLRVLASRVQSELDAGRAPSFGQVIFYPDTGEVHISLRGATKFHELAIGKAVAGGPRQYSALSSLDQLPNVPRAASMLAMVVGVGLTVAFFFPAIHSIRI